MPVKRNTKTLGEGPQNRRRDFYLVTCSFIFEPKKNNASMGSVFSIDSCPEVLVIRNENPVLNRSLLNDLIVTNSAGLVIDGENFVSLPTEPMCHRGTRALVHQE